MTAYYNEIDPYAAQWLRNLIDAGHIAPGDVDERSIEDVAPSELSGYNQCHFFAGIGVWSLALRQAGWPDDKPVWTGSCPCQPFSAAGKGAGFDDERHLWPSFHWLIQQCRPPEIFGEQVASKAVEPWIDLVQADLEEMGYAFGCVAFPSAGVGAPHIRDRAYWVADTDQHSRIEASIDGGSDTQYNAEPRGESGGLAYADGGQLKRVTVLRGAERYGEDTRRAQGSSEPWSCGEVLGMGHASGESCERHTGGVCCPEGEGASTGCADGRVGDRYPDAGDASDPSPTNGHWGAADWLFCRDGKWRPVEPSTFPLAHGDPSRVGRLRAYGNAINAKAAEEFIRSAMDRNNG